MKILIVEDNVSMLKILRKFLIKENITTEEQISAVEDGNAAVESLSQRHFELVLADINLPGMNGLDLLKHIKEKYENTEVILMTGFPELQSFIEGVHYEASAYLKKPFQFSTLKKSIENVMGDRLSSHSYESQEKDSPLSLEEKITQLKGHNLSILQQIEIIQPNAMGLLMEQSPPPEEWKDHLEKVKNSLLQILGHAVKVEEILSSISEANSPRANS